jgi:SAM-dependent methyltransferase
MRNQWDTYADLYDQGIGKFGDELHTKSNNPLLKQFVGNVSGKTVVDLGCGNAYLYSLLSSAKKYIGVDSAKKLVAKTLKEATIVIGDIAKKIPLESATADIAVANMVCQYLPELDTFARESARILRKKGLLVIIVDHPAHALFIRAQELAGKTNEKFITSGSYFNAGLRKKKSLWDKAVLEYYHRPIKDYINPFTDYFHLEAMGEVSEDGEKPRILGLKWRKA